MDERADFKESVKRLAAAVFVEAPATQEETGVVAPISTESAKVLESAKPRLRPKGSSSRLRPARQNLTVEPNIVAVTTRFPKEIDVLVTKASFAQRMNELSPGTKQEILVEAARDWLRHNGYLSKEESEPDEDQAA